MNLHPKQTMIALGGAVLVIAAGSAMIHRGHADPAAPSPKTDVPYASVVAVQRGAISNNFSAAGEFLPYQEVDIHAKVAGYIRKIYVDIGDRVRAGEILATLEVPELLAQVEGAKAGVEHSREEIERAQNDVASAAADHAALHAAATRLEQVSKSRPGLIAEQELDDAEAKDRSSQARVDAAKSALAAAKQQLEIARATSSQAAALSDYSRITAPFEGVVTWRYADTGALVQAGTSNNTSQPVVKLAQINVLRLRIPVPENLTDSIKKGEPVRVNVQATGERFTGKVSRFTDSLDRTTRTMQIEVDVPNPNYHLAPGMYANVVLEVQNHSNALVVPISAILRENNKATVLLVDGQNRIQIREVKTGIESANRVEIVSGLNPGDRLVVGNPAVYHQDEQVNPKPTMVAANEDGEER